MGRRLRALRLLLAVAVVTVVVVVLGVLAVRGGDEAPSDGAARPATPTPTPLGSLDTTTLAVSRASFCDAVTTRTVESALGAAPTTVQAYDDGDRVRLVRGTQDVSHEFGCLWKAGKTIARSWVFAPPVTTDRGRQLARAARRTADCERLREAPDYGRRSVALLCPTTRGSEVSFRGLYGDAWLTCTLSAPRSVERDDLLDRADLYCASVAQAASA